MDAVLSSPWWVLLLAVVGAIALFTLTLELFSNVGEERSASMPQSCTVGSDDFIEGLTGTINAPLQSGGSIRLLNNGDEIFPAMLEAIGRAERSVNFMVYIWKPGQLSDRVFDALTERARAGVGVRVLVDGLGGYAAPAERIDELQAAGGQWAWFHPPHFGKLTRFHKRNHRRVMVMDGRVGYTGGVAVDDKWLGNASDPDHWRDAMVEVHGCLASNLQSAFTQLWSHVTGEVLLGPSFYPPADEQRKEDDALPGEPISRHTNVVSSPSTEAHPLRRVFWISFQAASARLYITNPYFVPDRVMRQALKDRARAGVDVRALVPNEHIDVPIIRWASHSYYEELLEAGVRIYEYQPTMIHHKHLVVDGVWSVVGSANMDVRSKELNQENVLGVIDRGFAAEVERTFFDDLERSREITLEDWRKRPLWRRPVERVLRVFEEQF